jgi:hypothetical protein
MKRFLNNPEIFQRISLKSKDCSDVGITYNFQDEKVPSYKYYKVEERSNVQSESKLHIQVT